MQVEGHAPFSPSVTTVVALQHITYPQTTTDKSPPRKTARTRAGLEIYIRLEDGAFVVLILAQEKQRCSYCEKMWKYFNELIC